MSLVYAVLALAMAADESNQSPPTEAPRTTTVDGVTVSGAKAELKTEIDRRSYSVANDLQGATGNLADVLRNIPSVEVDLNGNLSLRGDRNVTVLIDGQPSSQFKGDSLAQTLQSMPANRIDRIEVMTNPSAAFSSDGAGIINFITKKAVGAGRTGSVQVAVGSYGGVRTALVGGYNTANLRLTGDVTFSHQIQELRQSNRSINVLQGVEQVRQDTTVEYAAAHVGAEYDLDARTRVSGDLRASFSGRDTDASSHFDLRDADDASVLLFDRLSPVEMTPNTIQGTTSWRRRFGDGHDLSLNLNADRQEQTVDRFDERTTALPLGAPLVRTQAFENTVISQAIFKIDYNRPAGGGKLQFGNELVFIDGQLDSAQDEAIGEALLSLDLDRFHPQQSRNDTYITYERSFGDLSILGGLRGQFVDLKLDRETQGDRYRQNYADLYPTLHLDYGLGEGRHLRASYSRRATRPIFANLNPAERSQSPQSVIRGNPNLGPERTSSFELGYEHRSGPSTLLATLYYRTTSDAFTTLATDLGDGVLLAQPTNAGERHNGGLELVTSGRYSPKLTYNLSANIYHIEIEAPGPGFPVNRSATTAFGRANLNWQMMPKGFVQLNVFANGKAIFPQGYVAPSWSGNIGYRHKMNDKLSWMLVAQDPFGTLDNRLVLDTPTGQIRRTSRANSRLFTFTLVKSFGGAKPRDPNFEFAPGGTGAGGDF